MSKVRPRLHRLAVVSATGVVPALLVVGAAPPTAASSHRDAPGVAQDPTADGLDTYAFMDRHRPGMVNLITTWGSQQDPASGPSHGFGNDVLYRVAVDNDDDAVEDVTYDVRFTTLVKDPTTTQYATGPVTGADDPDLNVSQRYTIRVTDVDAGTSRVLGTDLPVPPANTGLRTTPGYVSTMHQHVRPLPGGGQVFAGPADDPFFADRGAMTDSLGLRPLNEAHDLAVPAAPGVDGFAGSNVLAIAVQVPVQALTADRLVPADGSDPDAVLGVWSTASRRVSKGPAAGRETGPADRFVQVSRVGMPHVNEWLMPLGVKDAYNASRPSQDAQSYGRYTDPEAARLLDRHYDALITPPPGGATRTDLLPFFLTGIRTLNGTVTGTQPLLTTASSTGNEVGVPAEYVRLNTGIPASPSENRLGWLAGDRAGFPNGRRLADDVTDTTLRVLVGGTALAPPNVNGESTNQFPNNALTDGVDGNDRPFQSDFPYVAVPQDGYSQAG